MLELLGRHVNLHGYRLGLHHASMELWHFLDQGVRDWVSDRITLDILWIQLAEDLELLLDQPCTLYLLLLSRGENVLSLRPFPFFCLEGGLAEGGGQHGLSFGI